MVATTGSRGIYSPDNIAMVPAVTYVTDEWVMPLKSVG